MPLAKTEHRQRYCDRLKAAGSRWGLTAMPAKVMAASVGLGRSFLVSAASYAGTSSRWRRTASESCYWEKGIWPRRPERLCGPPRRGRTPPGPDHEELRDALHNGADAAMVVSRDDAWPLRAALLVRHLDPDVPIVATIFDPRPLAS